MHSIHFFDESTSTLFHNDGHEIKLEFDMKTCSSHWQAQERLTTWAQKAGIIASGEEIALLC